MINKKPQLVTYRLTLKSLEDKDQESMMKIVKDPKVKKTYMLPDFDNEDQEKQFFQRLKRITESNEHLTYGIYLKDRLIGFINDVTMSSEVIEVGYFIDSNEWNKGYASEALWAYMKQVFELGFYKVEAAYFEGNTASAKVMEKCCMHPSGKTEVIKYRNEDCLAIYYEVNKHQFLVVYQWLRNS